MEKYLIYQDKNQILKKKPIKDMAKAEQIVKLYGGKTVKIDGEDAHIVGIGNDEVFRSHQIITDQQPTNYYAELKKNVAYYKEHGKWPS